MATEVNRRTVMIKAVERAGFHGKTAHMGTGTAFEGAQLGKQGYKTGLTIKQEEEYCKELGLPVGTLSKHNRDFWARALNIRIDHNKPYPFIVGGLLDEIKLGALLENNRVVKNELELKKNPRAEFYIVDKEAKAIVEEAAIDTKMSALNKLGELSATEQRGFLKLYGVRGLSDVSEAFVKTSLFKEVDKDPKRFMTLVNNPDIKLRIDIHEMLEEGKLQKKGNYYHFNDEMIGSSMDLVVAYFKDISNQSILIAVKAETKAKKASKSNKK